MDYDYELLELLRHHTVLNFKQKILILKKIEKANINQRIINAKEHCNIEANYYDAYSLEYHFRMKNWQYKINELYTKYGKGQDLHDFSIRVLMDKETERIKKSKK